MAQFDENKQSDLEHDLEVKFLGHHLMRFKKMYYVSEFEVKQLTHFVWRR